MWIFRGSRKSTVEESRGEQRAPELFLTLGARHRTPVLFLLLSAYFLLPTSYSRSFARGLYEVREIKPGVFLWTPEDVLDVDGDPQFSRTPNASFIITSEGAVVVNTTNSPFHAREVLYEVRQRTEQPVRYVIDTDAHADLMMGNEAFVDERAAILSTTAAQSEMRWYRYDLARRLREDENWRLQGRMRGIHPTPASQSFDTEMTLRLGGQEIRLVRMSGGHSDGDAVVYLPAQKVLFMGHLFESGFFPRFSSSNVRRWIEILRQLEAWDVEVYVPAHGAPGGKKDLADFRQFLEWLVNEVTTRAKEGKSLSDVKRELNLTETYKWSARELAPRALEEVFQQVAREHSVSPAASPPGNVAPPPPADSLNQVP